MIAAVARCPMLYRWKEYRLGSSWAAKLLRAEQQRAKRTGAIFSGVVYGPGGAEWVSSGPGKWPTSLVAMCGVKSG